MNQFAEPEVGSASEGKPLTSQQIWWLAARPKTLPAAAAGAIVGSATAYAGGLFHIGVALATLLAALLLQVGANLANDVFDYYRGADTGQRLGPLRVTQAGLLSPQQVLTGMWLVFGMATVLGVYLAWVGGWPVVLIGLAAIAAAIAYTGGPFPYGYYGFGDLMVFIFFGPVAVCGVHYIHTGTVSPLAIWASLPMGFLITAILAVNNLRDIDNDRQAGKMTLAVRLGRLGTRWEYLLCLTGAYLVPLATGIVGITTGWVLLSWLSLPSAFSLIRNIWHNEGRELNQALAGTGRLTLVFGLLFSLGLLVASPWFLRG